MSDDLATDDLATEAAATQIIALYERTARAWDAVRPATLGPERAWIDQLTTVTRPGGAVLDLGCGTGDPIARALLARGFPVTGVDASPTLIALARARLPDADWCVADMRTLALGRRFDAIVAWHSVFHLTRADQRAMFAVFASHAAPGAALLFTSGPEAGEAIGSWQGEPLFHASLDATEYRALLAEHGFAVLAHTVCDPACGGATVWLAQRTAVAETRRHE